MAGPLRVSPLALPSDQRRVRANRRAQRPPRNWKTTTASSSIRGTVNQLPGEYHVGYYHSSANGTDVYRDDEGQPAAPTGNPHRSNRSHQASGRGQRHKPRPTLLRTVSSRSIGSRVFIEAERGLHHLAIAQFGNEHHIVESCLNLCLRRPMPGQAKCIISGRRACQHQHFVILKVLNSGVPLQIIGTVHGRGVDRRHDERPQPAYPHKGPARPVARGP